MTAHPGGVLLKRLDSAGESNCENWTAGLTLSHPGTLPTDRADLTALLLSLYGFQMGRYSSPMAGSSMKFATLVTICLLNHWYSTNTVSSLALCPHCRLLLSIDLVYSWSKSIYKYRTLLPSLQYLRVCPLPSPVPPISPFSSPAFTVQADSLLLFYPVDSCPPIHPLLSEGLFTLGLAAHTSLIPMLTATDSRTHSQLHEDKQAKQKGPITERSKKRD